MRPNSEIAEVLPRADVVIVATALTPETEGLVNKDFLARMADGAPLVNVSRGPPAAGRPGPQYAAGEPLANVVLGP